MKSIILFIPFLSIAKGIIMTTFAKLSYPIGLYPVVSASNNIPPL